MIPNFQALMLPLLKLASDREEHTHADAVVFIADTLGLSEAERNELLPSGGQTRIGNRVAWARAHMKAAGLLASPARGRFRITDEGLSVLAGSPAEITMKFLEQFPSYVAFRTGKLGGDGTKPPEPSPGSESSQTPEEAIETGYTALRLGLAADLLDRVKSASPAFFEQLVIDLLVAMGYGGSRADAAKAVGQSGDEGVDGIINEDKLGLDVVYVQAKRWQGTVGRPAVQAFAGSLEGKKARKGVLITTSAFSADAQDYVGKIEKRIVLVDGQRLADLMIDHGVGVTRTATYALSRLDEDYFPELTSSGPEVALVDQPEAAVVAQPVDADQ